MKKILLFLAKKGLRVLLLENKSLKAGAAGLLASLMTDALPDEYEDDIGEFLIRAGELVQQAHN